MGTHLFGSPCSLTIGDCEKTRLGRWTTQVFALEK